MNTFHISLFAHVLKSLGCAFIDIINIAGIAKNSALSSDLQTKLRKASLASRAKVPLQATPSIVTNMSPALLTALPRA